MNEDLLRHARELIAWLEAEAEAEQPMTDLAKTLRKHEVTAMTMLNTIHELEKWRRLHDRAVRERDALRAELRAIRNSDTRGRR